MKFNIIIPFYKNYETIENLLLSIKDQDHKDYNVTIVIDGEDEKSSQLLTGFLDDKKYKFNLETLKDNKGAPTARNFGAKISGESLLDPDTKEDILFFVDADCVLRPSILYDFNTQFELDSELDFCYGNYKFGVDDPPCISQDYDPYLLDTMNYISTMSPVKRSVFDKVEGFDEDRKYFQDWGLFWKIANAGGKGKYLGKNYYVFSTKKPTEDSISGSQGLTLAEKCKEFREYYGITDKELVVTTWGAPLQAIQRAKMLNADYVGASKGSDRMAFPSNYQFENWKYTYVVGCYNQTISALENHLTCIYGKPIYHFIGTDVFTMFNVHSMAALVDIQKMFKVQGAKLLSNSSRCQEELIKCGIETELLFTPVYDIDQYKNKEPLPEKFTVAVYISGTNRAHMVDGARGHSNIPLILDVAEAMPDIEFKLFGIDNMYGKERNVEYCGLIPEANMVDFINECSMVIRSTIHDGFPQLPIQFMLCGRQALVSCPDEEMLYAEKLGFEDNLDWEVNKSEIITKIYDMRNKQVDENANAYYKELMGESKYRKRIYQIMDEMRDKDED